MASILVVDDDPDFVEVTRMVLASEGFDVLSASNGDGALRAIQQERPDVLVLDVMMSSVLDGLDLARRLSEDPSLPRIPVIMVSSMPDSSMAGLFPTDEYLPIDAWLTKPVRPRELVQRIRSLLGIQPSLRDAAGAPAG